MSLDFLLGDRVQGEACCRQQCQAVYLCKKTVLCRVLGKYICYCPSQDTSITPHLALNGYWEWWLTKFIYQLVQPGWHCIDAGANVGYYTLLLVDLVGPQGDVLALEANKDIYDNYLNKNCVVNGYDDRVGRHNVLLWSRDDLARTLFIQPNNCCNSSSCCQSTPVGYREQMITTLTLDTLVQRCNWDRVNFIKLDIEGSEQAAWQGMLNVIYNNKDLHILMEFTPSYPYQTGSKQFLQEIANKYPLRIVTNNGQTQDDTISAILDQQEVVTLYLHQ